MNPLILLLVLAVGQTKVSKVEIVDTKPAITYGRIFLECNDETEITSKHYIVRILDDNFQQKDEYNLYGPNFHLWNMDIEPKDFDIIKVRNFAQIKLVKYPDSRNNQLVVLDNFEEEYSLLNKYEAEYRLIKKLEGLSKRQLNLLSGLGFDRYSIRQTCRRKIMEDKDFQLVYWASRSKDSEVKAASKLIFETLTVGKPLLTKETK